MRDVIIIEDDYCSTHTPLSKYNRYVLLITTWKVVNNWMPMYTFLNIRYDDNPYIVMYHTGNPVIYHTRNFHPPRLTHWDRHKMVAILQTTLLKALLSIEIIIVSFKSHWILFLRVPIDKTSAMVHVSGVKPLPKPKMTQFIDTYSSRGLNELSGY